VVQFSSPFELSAHPAHTSTPLLICGPAVAHGVRDDHGHDELVLLRGQPGGARRQRAPLEPHVRGAGDGSSERAEEDEGGHGEGVEDVDARRAFVRTARVQVAGDLISAYRRDDLVGPLEVSMPQRRQEVAIAPQEWCAWSRCVRRGVSFHLTFLLSAM